MPLAQPFLRAKKEGLPVLAAPRAFVCLCNLVPGDVPQPALLPVVDDVGGHFNGLVQA